MMSFAAIGGRNMESPLCTICVSFKDNDGLLSCEAFPRGIPEAFYPWGCMNRTANPDVATARFKPRSGMEEITKRWKELTCVL